jgi:hypothetical protein
MGNNERFEGIYTRKASIRMSFQWNDKRYLNVDFSTVLSVPPRFRLIILDLTFANGR